jgi:hypothetical protein
MHAAILGQIKRWILLRLQNCLGGELDVGRLHRLAARVLGKLRCLSGDLQPYFFQDNAKLDGSVVPDPLSPRFLDEPVDRGQTELRLGQDARFPSYAVNY